MNMIFNSARRSCTDWATLWMFLTRLVGISATTCIAVIIATATVAFAIYIKRFPRKMKTSIKVIVCVSAEILSVAIVLASYWMTLYSYGVI